MVGNRGSDVEPRLEQFFAGRPEVVAACLFGSVAEGKAGGLSDLDVGVLLGEEASQERENSLAYAGGLVAQLMRIVGRNDVDLVLLHEAGPLLAFRILRSARFFFVRDARALGDFRFRALQRYLDTRPLREIFSRAQAERLARGGFARMS
jgi:predicted nucleotidyltransferase